MAEDGPLSCRELTVQEQLALADATARTRSDDDYEEFSSAAIGSDILYLSENNCMSGISAIDDGAAACIYSGQLAVLGSGGEGIVCALAPLPGSCNQRTCMDLNNPCSCVGVRQLVVKFYNEDAAKAGAFLGSQVTCLS
jgi:hypothetical protein